MIGAELESRPYEARLRSLLKAGVGLWDTVNSAFRHGSLDSNIRGLEANPLADLVASLPELKAIGFNGGRSASIGAKQLVGSRQPELLFLPSSSPAYTLPFDAKLERWMALRPFLQPGSS